MTKLRASDGAVLGTFSVGTNPVGVVFDGTNIWVTNRDGNAATKLAANNGAALGTFSVGASPLGLASDGINIWVTTADSNDVTKLRASDGAVVGTLKVGTAPGGVTFEGANIWVANPRSNTVTKLDRAMSGARAFGGPRCVGELGPGSLQFYSSLCCRSVAGAEVPAPGAVRRRVPTRSQLLARRAA